MRLARLKARREFLRVAETRKRFTTPGFILQMRAHEADEIAALAPIRVGFTVSRKVGNAVVRNRVKRRLRAAADQILTTRATEHRDFVLIGRREGKERPFADLLGDLDTALARLGAQRRVREELGAHA